MDMNTFGVYALVFQTDNGKKVYIGSTAESFKQRLRRHINMLKNGNHPNPHMQSLFAKYGDPEFRILEVCEDRENTYLREQAWIDLADPSWLINLGPALPSPTFGRKRSIDEKIRISIAKAGKPGNSAFRGRTHSTETRKKMSIARSGERHPLFGKKHSEETKAKISKAHTGKKNGPHSKETREKIAQALRGKPMSENAKNALLASHLGKPLSKETRQKLSKAHMGNQCRKGIPHTQETKEKISKAVRLALKKKVEEANE
jgi:group I intron endonuclease